jgi:hypothetical protein
VMKRIVSLLAVLAMVALAAAPALAQGPQGPGDPELHGPPHANSICSFSGLNDTPNAPFPEGGRTQNYGQLVRRGVSAPGDQPGRADPGYACNAHLFPYPPGPPPPE